MIYVNQKQLDQVEYIIEQSAKGHHVLFDADVIRKVFESSHRALSRSLKKGQPMPEMDISEDFTSAEKHIENLILQPTILSKRAYLENLTPDVLDQVIRTYFSIVENNIFEGLKYSQ